MVPLDGEEPLDAAPVLRAPGDELVDNQVLGRHDVSAESLVELHGTAARNRLSLKGVCREVDVEGPESGAVRKPSYPRR